MKAEDLIAINALAYLSDHQGYISSDELAHKIGSNAALIRKVMLKLKKTKLIKTKVGAMGGYYLSESARTITLDQILQACDEHDLIKINNGKPIYDERLEIVQTRLNAVCVDLSVLCHQRLNTITLADLCMNKEEGDTY